MVTGKSELFGQLFPAKYDFYKFLANQATANAEAVTALTDWLASGTEEDEARLQASAGTADTVRKELEKNLVEAFTTPFDRGDVYYISVTMQRSLDYAASTLTSMKAYEVSPDDSIREMGAKLRLGAETFASSVKQLKSAPSKAELFIPSIRSTHADIEQLYRVGMRAVFNSGDPMDALKHREIYHHLKDSSKYQADCVDILHRIIVRLT